MSDGRTDHLRILVADERLERLDAIARVVEGMGHAVVAREVDVGVVAARTDELDPDLAMVAVGESPEHALELVSQIVREATCPVIAVLGQQEPGFVREALERGLFGFVVEAEPDEIQAEMDVVLRRFGELRDLEAALERRAITERAKGILMAQHHIDERAAFELLRAHSRRTGRRLVDVAAAVADVHVLLTEHPQGEQSDATPPARKTTPRGR